MDWETRAGRAGAGFFMVQREMKRKAHKDNVTGSDGLSKAGREDMLRAVDASKGNRISQATVDGQRVWIKRYDAVGRGFAKWAHAAAPVPVLHPFLRSSPWLDPNGMADREVRKSAAFLLAGFATPAIYYVRDAVIVSAHCELLVAHKLTTLPDEAHDALLIRCADALGRAHAAGLCHGRPHPRDMYLTGNEIGFLDFEEEPEAAMPLAVAQARDAWLLIQQIAGATKTPGGDVAAFEAWRSAAPAAAVAELRKASDLFSPLTSLLNLAGKLWLGADAMRARNAGMLLREIFDKETTGKPERAPNRKSAS
jgi:hypothetical protein